MKLIYEVERNKNMTKIGKRNRGTEEEREMRRRVSKGVKEKWKNNAEEEGKWRKVM